ncbi:hypothetical protein [Streptomyces sp. MMG1121]|uniref:hypothetical protein n=1 Tax=Streptomyces sp. MMG1121 TaxID=1415544 RepID=UPI0006AEFCC0|nr:hypothetical protein [Streptomyces sp. MMG1121]KOV62712.1 hypothetical protein ADK64_23400 [Streptomyces sp. MMG1121]
MSRVLPAGRRLRWMTAVVVPALLSPLAGCSSSSTAVEACMAKQADSVSSTDLTGTYAGEGDAKGTTITLTSTDGRPGGTVTVHRWPTGDWYKSELGAEFNGSGTWSVRSGTGSDAHARVRLSLTEPRTFLNGDTLDKLSIAKGAGQTYLYEDDDPDVCPKFRLKMTTSRH